MTLPDVDAATVDPLDQLARWRDAGVPVALATVVTTWGSSPRPAGSQLAVAGDGRFEGSVSGGCVEGAVVEAAQRAIGAGAHDVLAFGVTDEMAWEVGLACGGEMEVLVEPVAPRAGDGDWLDALQRHRSAKRPAVATVDLGTGARDVFAPPAPGATPDPEPAAGAGAAPPDAVAAAARDALREDACRLLEADGRRLFVQPFNPPLRLVVVGAVHIAQSLARMAALCGFEVVVVDPRGAFATADRFPGVALSRAWPDAALEALAIDARCAVVTLTHDPKLDDPALEIALRSPAFYVGCLGSRRTQARRVERMRALGLSDDAIARIHGPIGLDIGARSSPEIAVSILAEITARLRAGTPAFSPAARWPIREP